MNPIDFAFRVFVLDTFASLGIVFHDLSGPASAVRINLEIYHIVHLDNSYLITVYEHGHSVAVECTLEYTDLPMGKDAIRGLVNRCAELAGITKHLTPHIFIHTYATHLLEMGVSIYRLKELLCHSNIINTMVYLHIIKPVEEVSFSPIDRLFPIK